jgi:hypothetical protein
VRQSAWGSGQSQLPLLFPDQKKDRPSVLHGGFVALAAYYYVCSRLLLTQRLLIGQSVLSFWKNSQEIRK